MIYVWCTYIYFIYIYICVCVCVCVCVTYINTSVFLQTYRKQTMPVSLYQLNQIKTSTNSAKKWNKDFNWVTLSTIPWVSNIWTSSNLHHIVHLFYAKMWSFAHMQNKSNPTFPWHVKNPLAYTVKNNKQRKK